MPVLGPGILATPVARPPSGRGLFAQTKPLSAALGSAIRAQSVFGGTSIAGTSLPDPTSGSFPAEVFLRNLARVNDFQGAFNPAQRGGFRGGSSSGPQAGGALSGPQARSIGPADSTTLSALGFLGAGPVSAISGALNRVNQFSGPTAGVIGPTAPQVGTQNFANTVNLGNLISRFPGVVAQGRVGVPGQARAGFGGFSRSRDRFGGRPIGGRL
jgi:hypothetical protein